MRGATASRPKQKRRLRPLEVRARAYAAEPFADGLDGLCHRVSQVVGNTDIVERRVECARHLTEPLGRQTHEPLSGVESRSVFVQVELTKSDLVAADLIPEREVAAWVIVLSRRHPSKYAGW